MPQPHAFGVQDLAAAERALRDTFGHADFRPGQREIVAAVLAGDDVFALMPTGAGKSLLYQLPAALPGGPVIFVSPLISLMRDQILALQDAGLCAVALHSALAADEMVEALRLIAERRVRLLYLAPERLALDETIEMLARLKPRLIAVDEAHCVSRWGHDFRPEYARIGDFAKKLGDPQIVAVTATAGAKTRADVEALLFQRKPRFFAQSFYRPNIRIAIRPRLAPLPDVARMLRAHAGQCGIVYCNSRAGADALARQLAEIGLPARAYHAGLDAATRTAHQDEFLERGDAIMVATIAFGMGVDKPDVRFVCHVDLPHSIEAYYQEIGRAGRDGAPAEALAYISRFAHAPDDSHAYAMQRLARSFDCRWRAILAALGEAHGACGRCDNCRSGRVFLRHGADLPHRAGRLLRAGARRLFAHAAAPHDEAIETAPMAEPVRRPESTPMNVLEARRLAHLRAARDRLARARRIAPRQVADDYALEALARLEPFDAQAARAIVEPFDPCARDLVGVRETL